MFNIDFNSVTPKPTPKTFAQSFIEASEKNPWMVTLNFRQEGDTLYLKTIFTYKNGNQKKEINAPATEDLIFAILCAFREDLSKIKDYDKNEHEWISTDDENEDLHVEMFKLFLASPYQKLDLKCWKPDPENYPDDKWFSIRFPVDHNRFVSFCLPNYKEMYALYKDARDNNIGNNK